MGFSVESRFGIVIPSEYLLTLINRKQSESVGSTIYMFLSTYIYAINCMEFSILSIPLWCCCDGGGLTLLRPPLFMAPEPLDAKWQP